MSGWCEVRRCGGQVLVQDLGRSGLRHLGVSPGGVCDPRGVRIINALVGNEGGAAVLEIAFGGLELVFSDRRQVAWAGADVTVRCDQVSLPPGRLGTVAAGHRLRIGYARSGCRLWLAVSGGFDVPMVMGAKCTDVRSGFGGWEGRPLVVGDRLPLGPGDIVGLSGPSRWGASEEWVSRGPEASGWQVAVIRGAQWECVHEKSKTAFLGETYTVTAEADRMGVRLQGTALQFSVGEGPSEPVAPGTIQVPASGQPIVLLTDARTMGGYPRLAHVISPHLARVAQWRTGDEVRFHLVDLAEATRLADEEERELAWFLAGVALKRSRS